MKKFITCPMPDTTCPYYNGYDDCCNMMEYEGKMPFRSCDAFELYDEVDIAMLEHITERNTR